MMAWRLCMSPLEGSSRRMRLTTILISRSVNQPFGLNQALVCTAEAGMRKKDARPTVRVIRPSMRKSQRQPAQPATPRMCRSAKASKEVMIVVPERVVQKKLRCKFRMGSIVCRQWTECICLPEAGWQFS